MNGQASARDDEGADRHHHVDGEHPSRIVISGTALRRSSRVATLVIAAKLAAMGLDASPPIDDGLTPGWRERVADWASGKERIHELHLFGSRAKGEHLPDSDVDLAYVLTGSDPGEVLAYAMYESDEWQPELETLIGATVQLECADPLDDIVVWPAVREHGQLLYRKPGYLPVE